MDGVRAIFYDCDDAEAVVARLRSAGRAASLVRERLHGEDDDEDHPWAVVSDAPVAELTRLCDEHDGWLDAEATSSGSTPAPLDLPTAPRRIKRPR